MEKKITWVSYVRIWDPETKEYVQKDEPPTFEGKAKPLFFVVSDDLTMELAPVFLSKTTANEIAKRVNEDEPFFDRIPAVIFGQKYPRPLGMDVKLGVSKRRQLRDVRQS